MFWLIVTVILNQRKHSSQQLVGNICYDYLQWLSLCCHSNLIINHVNIIARGDLGSLSEIRPYHAVGFMSNIVSFVHSRSRVLIKWDYAAVTCEFLI